MLMLINALISSFILLMDKLNMCIVKKVLTHRVVIKYHKVSKTNKIHEIWIDI